MRAARGTRRAECEQALKADYRWLVHDGHATMKTMTRRGMLVLSLALMAGLAPRAGATVTMANNVQIGNPIVTVTPTVSGTTNTYNFADDALAMAGFKLYYNSAQRNVVLTNLAGVADSGAGGIDTGRSGAGNHTGYIELYSSGAVQIGGNLATSNAQDAATGRIVVNATDVRIGGSVLTHNLGNGDNAGAVTIAASAGEIGITNYVASFNHGGGSPAYSGPVLLTAARIAIGGALAGYAVDAHARGGGQHMYGANVTLTATNGVTLATGGIDAHGFGGGDVLVSDGSSGSAGDVYVGGSVLSYSDEAGRRAGSITLRGAEARVTGNLVADYTQGGTGAYLSPVQVRGTRGVQIDGYVSSAHTSISGNITGNHDVTLTGSRVTVNGVSGAYSILTYDIDANTTDYGGNICLVATNGDISVVGGYDAYGAAGLNYRGYVTNIASGNITIGNLNAGRFRAITLIAGTSANWIHVTGVITNFTTNASPKRIVFPAGSVVSNDVYYSIVNNGVGLSGTYAIYVSTTDTGQKLMEGPPPAAGGNPPIMLNVGATNVTDTTAALIGTMASTGTAASVAYVFWSTTDCTNNEAAWLSTGGGVSNLSQRAQGETFTNTVSGLSANTPYYYNFMGSNSAGKGWAATSASPWFHTGGPPGVSTGMGATAVGPYSAVLNGDLINGLRAQVFVCYGTDFTRWAFTNALGERTEGAFGTSVSGLAPGTMYYYQCGATNAYGDAWSGVASFTTGTPTTNTMSGDIPIGDPIGPVSAVGTAPYTYDFGNCRVLDMAGHKLYRNDSQRDVCLTNLLGLINGGSVDTTRSGDGNTTGYVKMRSYGAIAIGSIVTYNPNHATAGFVDILAGGAIQVGTNIDTHSGGWGKNGGAVSVAAGANPISVGGYVATYTTIGGSLSRGGAVTLSGGSIGVSNALGGYAIDAQGTGAGTHQSGGNVTLTATGGVTLSTGGINCHGADRGGAVAISDGAGGPAGPVFIGGSILSDADNGFAAGPVAVRGAIVRVAGNVVADYAGGGVGAFLAPVTIAGTGGVQIDGYVSSAHTSSSGNVTGNHDVMLTGSRVTVNGVSGAYSILTSDIDANTTDYGGNISVIATAGDIRVAGGYDAYGAAGLAYRGYVTNIASGNITIGSLDAGRFRAITLVAGSSPQYIYVTGALTNFTVSESPKKFTFPAGSIVSNDVYYVAASNTAIALTGTYAIYVSAADTGKLLKEGPPPSPPPPGTAIFLR